MKLEFNRFLKDKGAKNNQLVILFAYFFLLLKGASEEQFIKLKKELTNYLDKKIVDHQNSDENESLFEEKVNINKQLVGKYFNGEGEELNF